VLKKFRAREDARSECNEAPPSIGSAMQARQITLTRKDFVWSALMIDSKKDPNAVAKIQIKAAERHACAFEPIVARLQIARPSE
jgi:hypothetical protein